MKTRSRQTIAALAASAGLEVIAWDHTGKSHLKCTVRRRDGAQRFFVFPNSGSDRRGLKNSERDLARWADEGEQ